MIVGSVLGALVLLALAGTAAGLLYRRGFNIGSAHSLKQSSEGSGVANYLVSQGSTYQCSGFGVAQAAESFSNIEGWTRSP